MATCTFKTEAEFKKLEKQVGSDLATYTYFAYDGYPAMQTNTELRKTIGVPHVTFDDKVWAVAKKVRRYNSKNGTSHHFKKNQVGQSEQVRLEFVPNYLPVNIERQRQRDLAREERDKTWQEFNQKDFNELTPSDISEYAKLKQQVEDDIVVEDMQEVYGLTEALPELQVHILGEGQYEVGGEIYGSYEDALVAAEHDPFGFSEISAPEFVSLEKLDPELQSDLERMEPTIKLLDYLYPQGSQRLSKRQFYKEASELISMMKADEYSNGDIIEAVKCM